MQRTWIGLLALLLVMAAPTAAGAQPDELEPVPNTVLGPPNAASDAEITVIVQPGQFPFYWLELQRTTTRNGGSVVSATAESIQRDGRTVSYGIAELRLPPEAFGTVLGDILTFGTLVEGSIEGSGGVIADLVVTLSESEAVPVGSDPGSADSRLGQALDTAATVVLTIVSVVIVVGAAVIPVAILALVAYGVWRWARRRFEPSSEVKSRQSSEEPELVEG